MAVAVLVGLSLGWGWNAIGNTIGHPAEAASMRATASPSPDPSGPEASNLGWRAWYDLAGDECLSSFVDPWQAQYLVVSCETLHQAQVISVGQLESSTEYPGFDSLVRLTAEKCSGLGLINRDAYPALGELTIARTFPQNASEWDAHPIYLCIAAAPRSSFFDRSVLVASS